MAATTRPDALDRLYTDTLSLADVETIIAESRARQKLLKQRDVILESLRCQFACKVVAVTTRSGVAEPAEIEKLLRDIASNVCQALVEPDTILASSLRIGSRFLLDGRPVVITAIGPDRRTKVSFNYRRLDIVDRFAGCAPGYTNDTGRAELANDAVVEVCE